MYSDDNFDNEVHWESWIRFPLLQRKAIPEEAGPVKGLCRLNTETGTDARSFECSDGKIGRKCYFGQIRCARAMWLGSVESNSFRMEAIEINLGNNLGRDFEQTYLKPHFKPTTSNQFFWRADNLGGLDSLQLTCGVGAQVITSFSKVGRRSPGSNFSMKSPHPFKKWLLSAESLEGIGAWGRSRSEAGWDGLN